MGEHGPNDELLSAPILSLHASLLAHQVRVHPGFCRVKLLGVFLLPLDLMLASLLQD